MQTGLKGDGVLAFEPITIPATTKIKSLFLIPPVESIAQSEQPLSTTGGIFKRNLTTTGYSTSTTFTKQDPLVFTTIAADPLYSIPGVPGLRIVEILPHAADCAPNDESYVCGDYVKIQNNTNSVVDASNYRLRTDSSTSEASNAFMLDVVLMPGGYYTVRLKTDGAKMSLTDSGGYVWLEDIFGVVKYYDETMVYYPSASGSDKQGWSWALDGLEIWQWTSTPMPDNSNVITVPSEVLSVAIETECPAGKYRNPDTGRCKNIEEAIATLVACDEGEYRSPETNRCRKIAVASSISLTPCEPDEERNPATNRCRKTASTAVTIEPCPEGQERNPATNRCRAITSSTPATLTDAATTKTGISSYWLGGGVIVAAIGYGIYEWRSELAKLFRKFTPRSK